MPGRVVIPPRHSASFAQATARLVRSRIQLFFLFVAGLFLASLLLSYPFSADVLDPWELPFDFAVLFLALVGFLVSRRLDQVLPLKCLGYLMNALLLLTVSALYVIYPEAFAEGVSGHLLAFLVIVMAMPWNAFEVLLVGTGGLGLFLLALRLSGAPQGSDAEYLEVNIFIFVSAVLAAVVYKVHDEKKRREQFLTAKELEEKKQELERDLELARQVHRSLVPKSFENERVDIGVGYLPYSYIGGDYARFNFLSPDELLIFITDITGHGVPAALLVNRLHTEVSALAPASHHPGELLGKLDAFVREMFEGTQMFLSAYACLIDFKRGKLRYSNFGHPSQILYQARQKDVCYMRPQRHWMGLERPSASPIAEAELSFEPGDRILLFTDGLLEVRGRDGQFFGKAGLESFLKTHGALGSETFNQDLIQTIKAYNGEQGFSDDIFILNIRIKDQRP